MSPITGKVCDFCGDGVVQWDECSYCDGLGGNELSGARCEKCDGYGITDRARCNACGCEPISAAAPLRQEGP